MYRPEFFQKRVSTVFNNSLDDIVKKSDYLFAYLLVFQWILGVVLSLTIFPPTTIEFTQANLDFNFNLAFFFGGLVAGVPAYLCFYDAGKVPNRFMVAVSQMLFSIMFTHLTGGREATLHHVFVSLACLTFYRDWRVLVVASAIAIADHFIRCQYVPLSIYGELTISSWRAFEFSAWVIFLDCILVYAIKNSVRDMYLVAKHQVKFEETMDTVAEEICQRTRELVVSQKTVMAQQQALVQASKMRALGEMAGGIAHEINNPLTIISSSCSFLRKVIEKDKVDPAIAKKCLDQIENTIVRMAKIIQGLRTVSRETSTEEFTSVKVRDLMDDCLGLCVEKFKENGVNLIVDLNDSVFDQIFECRRVQVSQIFINLLGNAYDAVEQLPEKWVKIECRTFLGNIEFRITDSGKGIPKEIQQKIFQPFFTTKPVGKGTGLGLSLSISIVRDHEGEFLIDNQCPNTCFVISLPIKTNRSALAA